MKNLLVFLAIAAAAAGQASAQPRVGVSIGINEPGVYGRIGIGDVPREALVTPQAVIVAPPRVVVERRPIFLYVAPWEQANWRQYCRRYAACDQPVYFVREDWVHERYVREHPGWDRDHHWRGGPRDDRRFDGRGRDEPARDDRGRDGRDRDDRGYDHDRDDSHRHGPDRR